MPGVRARPLRGGTIPFVKRAPVAVVLVLIGAAILVPIGGGLVGSVGRSNPSSAPAGASATPASSAVAGGSASADPSATSGQTASPPATTPAPPSGPPGDVAIVPVTTFRSAYSATSSDEVKDVLAGKSNRYEALELVESDADAILAALGVDRPSDPARLVLAANAGTLSSDLAKNRKRLAIVRADDVWEGIRALGWDGRALFGVDRVKALADWPLTATLPTRSDGGAAYDPQAAWTLVAGGDIMLDRGVAKTLTVEGKGADFPFDGGTARITGHVCCSQFGWKTPTMARTGNAGAVRSLLEGADLAIANFENPAPDRFTWHTKGVVFSADPKLIDGLARAGIDYVSIGNNHIRDAGGNGIVQTIANLEKRGLASSGAGKNLAEARRPAVLEAGGQKVAILGYDTVAKYYAASATRAGSAQLTAAACRADVAAARKAGADVVIVFPHWGTEYDATPFGGQQRLARACIDAGADMIIGNHAHWAGAVETYDGKPIWYALGNFVFDQTWSEPTMEGMTLELTFVGNDLRQVRMRPHIILDRAQPNFMDPTGDGRVVMGQVFDASKGLLDW